MQLQLLPHLVAFVAALLVLPIAPLLVLLLLCCCRWPLDERLWLNLDSGDVHVSQALQETKPPIRTYNCMKNRQVVPAYDSSPHATAQQRAACSAAVCELLITS